VVTEGTGTVLTHKAVRHDGPGTSIVVKRYARADTAAYKCWGSGVRNEGLVEPLVPVRVPTLLRAWADGTDEYAELAWVEGHRPDVPVSPDLARTLGRILGGLHAQQQDWWGSLDGVHRFASAAEAFRSRFAAAIVLLGRSQPELAAAAAEWAHPRLARLHLAGPPCLVHGDFGPANLLVGPQIAVLDWEHARWGHPHEDWAKIRASQDFPEPNGFGTALEIGGLSEGWREATRIPPPDEPADELVLRVYYAICLGVFFWPADRRRLEWVYAVVSGAPGP
jgi:hypothetical protein